MRSKRAREALRVRNMGVVYALLLLVAVLTVATAATGRPSYLNGDNVSNILDQASLTAILAVFMTVVLVSGNFDLSVGSVAALSGAVALSVIDSHGFVVALVLALASGLVIGAVNGTIVQFVGINAFIVTLGTLTAVRGLVLIITDGRTVTVSDEASFDALAAVEGGFWKSPDLALIAGVVVILVAGALLTRRVAAQSRVGWRLPAALAVGVVVLLAGLTSDFGLRYSKPVYYMVAITVIVWAVLRFTVVGRRLYAVGGNAEAARLSGVNVDRYKVVPFLLTGLASAFVGFLYAAKLGAVNPTALSGTELTVLAAAILGGTSLFGGSGNVVFSVVGALFLFTIANGFNVLDLGANYQDLIEGVVIIIAAAVYTVAARRNQRPTAGADSEPTETATPSSTAAPHTELASR
jgi:ribose/xylose/arabinose/galactoside ABC-type transport system permease subunit